MSLIPVQEAVAHAKKSLTELYQDDRPSELALEEIELIDDGQRKLWSVTLGFDRVKVMKASALQSYMPAQNVVNRVYKTVFLDASTGEFVKMDMRQVQ